MKHRSSRPATPVRRHLARLTALALSLQVGFASALPYTFTGAAPVYTAQWFNGTATETHEFQYYLDWQGYCNAHAGSSCSNVTYWGSSRNWDLNAVPGIYDEAVVPAGQTVVLASATSVYQGAIPGLTATVDTVTASGRVMLVGTLNIRTGTFADLAFSGGTLNTSGGASVGLLSAAGTFAGNGSTTVINGVASDQWLFGVSTGHTVEFIGTYAGNAANLGNGVQLAPGSMLVNRGSLSNVAVSLNGGANQTTVPKFINPGLIQGNFGGGSVSLYNAGALQVGSGDLADIGPGGVHTGAFSGTSGSRMWFEGPWGQTFQASSSVHSDGLVWFKGGTNNAVHGRFEVAQLQLSNATLSIDSAAPVSLSKVTVDSLARLNLLTPTAPVVGDVSLLGGGQLQVAALDASTTSFASLSLSSGALIVDTPVTVAGPVQWQGGAINNGAALLTAQGGLTLAGSVVAHTLGGSLANAGSAVWTGGDLVLYASGTFQNLAGASFDIEGDLGGYSPGPFGTFANAGLLTKSAGTGMASLNATLRSLSAGSVEAHSGTLFVAGGLDYQGGTLLADSGAALQFGGNSTLAGTVHSSGAVNFAGNALTLAANAQFVNASSQVQVRNLVVNAGATLAPAKVDVFGLLSNAGTLTLAAGASHTANNVQNSGTLTASGDFSVGGTLTNTSTGVLASGANMVVTGSLTNDGSFDNHGTLTAWAGLKNTGVFNNHAGAGVAVQGGNSSLAGTVSNQGDMTFSGTTVLSGSLSNTSGATVTNWGGFTVASGASLANQGSVTNGGTFEIAAGSSLIGSGVYQQSYANALTRVNGTLQASQLNIDDGVLKGTGTVIGNVLLGATAQWKPGNSPGTFTVVGDVSVNGTAWQSPGGGNIELELASSTVFDRIQVSGGARFGDATLDVVLANGYTPHDGDSFAWLSAGSVTSNGAVTANVVGSPLWQALPTFSATGASVELMYVGGSPINSGTPLNFVVRAGESFYLGDSDSANLSTIDVAGDYSNRPGAALTVDSYVAVQSGGRFVNRGQLGIPGDNFTQGALSVGGTLLNQAQGQIYTGSLDNRGSIRNAGTLNVGGDFVNRQGASFDSSGSLNFNPGILTNRGQFNVSGTLQGGEVVNYGTLKVAATGQVTNTFGYVQGNDGSAGAGGPLTQVDGVLQAPRLEIQQGTLAGSGRIVGNVQLSASWLPYGPIVQPGAPGSPMNIDGNLTVIDGFFDVTLSDAGSSRLLVSGGVEFQRTGTVRFLLPTDPQTGALVYVPKAGDSFSWLVAGGGVRGLGGLQWELDMVTGGGLQTLASGYAGGPALDLQVGGIGEVWVASSGDGITFTAAPVPEPGSWGLMVAGVMALFWRARRVHGLKG